MILLSGPIMAVALLLGLGIGYFRHRAAPKPASSSDTFTIICYPESTATSCIQGRAMLDAERAKKTSQAATPSETH